MSIIVTLEVMTIPKTYRDRLVTGDRDLVEPDIRTNDEQSTLPDPQL